MAIRSINYTVTADGITPATERFAGTQEEHNATSLVFNLDSALRTSLTNYIPDHEIKYRFDIYDGEGNVLQGDDSSLVENGAVMESVILNLAEPAARYGGKISVYLVITAYSGDETKLNLYSFPAKLRFNNLPDGGEGDNNARESITTIAEAAKSAAISADNSAMAAAASEESAENAKQQTVDARFALENGASFVFDGGDSENEMNIGITVDSALSDVSENPVQNKVIKAEIDKKQDSSGVSDIISNALAEFITTIEFRNAVFLADHPVNSLYTTLDDTNPGEVYGGEWEQVAQGRAIVGVGTGTDTNSTQKAFVSGNNVGEYSHKLTVAELPNYTLPIGFSYDVATAAAAGSGVDFVPNNVSYNTGKINAILPGSDQSHNNIQPSYGVYVWKRIA